MRCRSNESANKDRKERRRGENSGLTSKTGVCALVRLMRKGSVCCVFVIVCFMCTNLYKPVSVVCCSLIKAQFRPQGLSQQTPCLPGLLPEGTTEEELSTPCAFSAHVAVITW